ncbi:hypothetical protein CspeluHIS016_0401670 [Cutaneotrichosporon spelunceum]|uniref:Uncharacterized protein n=1 Tax=Cutaneotrichosporon spelunceum TaxID=1672016 RepID=A0AAD3TVE7_9TREE|nr:hypothetical protein CspeluHIS016_0401670 [Cutaneotrichosporon spelunceum]
MTTAGTGGPSPGLSTPTAPAGLVVSKAGLEATARGDKVVGVLCLKITLPKDCDGRPQRWELFQGPKPSLRSIPALYPLPASLALASTSRHISTAAALLALPPPGAYPPTTSDPGLKPYIDVSRATDQVFVVVDSSPPATSEKARRRSSIGGRARNEWLVVLEFEAPIHEETTDDQTWFKAAIPTPKCLDNFIRFEIVPPDPECTSAEIVTMPRVLPLPSSVFDAHDPSTPSKRRLEEGWEDGEVPGAGSSDGSDEDSSWLRGRYQSTDVVALQWGFAPALGTPPDLRIAPHWDARNPSIGLTFEAVIAATDGPFRLEAVLPQGWGWSSLQIRGDGLVSWRSDDLQGVGALVSATATNADDSMSTVGAIEGPSDLASLDTADFSFELNSFQEDDSPALPTTPRLRRIQRHGATVLKVVPRTITPASMLELEFEHSGKDEEDDRVLLVEGTLAPLTVTLVSPDARVQIPFFRFEDATLPTECDVKCLGAELASQSHADDEEELPSLCSTTEPSVGTFLWTDESGAPLAQHSSVPVSGAVRVNVKRSIWGLQTLSVLSPWPANAEEVRVGVNVPPEAMRVVRASARGTSLPHALHTAVEDGVKLAEVRVGRGRDHFELVLEVANDDGVALPSLDGTGELRVELAGDGWDRPLAYSPVTNLERTDERVFTGDLTTVPYITFASAPSTPVAPTPPPPAEEDVKEAPISNESDKEDTTPANGNDKKTNAIANENDKDGASLGGESDKENVALVLTQSTSTGVVRKPSRARSVLGSLLSWNTLVNLILLWILGSLAGQVARLRAEVAFVADEARDLRLYGVDRANHTSVVHQQEDTGSRDTKADDPLKPGAEQGLKKETELAPRVEHGLGRVVHPSNWGTWLAHHPSLRAVQDTMSRLWDAVRSFFVR